MTGQRHDQGPPDVIHVENAFELDWAKHPERVI
jgi:hypothetical protein